MNTIKSIKLILVIAVATTILAEPVLAREITDQNIVDLTNQERTKLGLRPLVINSNLDQAAYTKSADMITKNYFEHYAFGTSPWMIIKKNGYNYQQAGENLAMDFNNAEGIVNAWMRSETHRNNLLNPDFEDIGVGVVKGEFIKENGQSNNTIMVTQMFGKKRQPIYSSAINIVKKAFLKRVIGWQE